MDKFEYYCAILDVSPGDDAAIVLKNFRSKIKKHHPDSSGEGNITQAQDLIDAYKSFQEGVPSWEEGRNIYKKATAKTQEPQVPRTPGSSLGKNTHWKRTHGRSGFGVSTQQRGRLAGNRIFGAVFPKQSTPFQENDLGTLWKDSYKKKGASQDILDFIREYAQNKSQQQTNRNGEKENFPEEYKHVELILFETLERYQQKTEKYQRSWVREFIQELNQIQILYRDLSRFCPSFSTQAIERVILLKELISKIRNEYHTRSV